MCSSWATIATTASTAASTGRGGEPGVGLLPIDNLIGRVMITFWSTDGSAAWLKPWTWFSAARWSRIGRTG